MPCHRCFMALMRPMGRSSGGLYLFSERGKLFREPLAGRFAGRIGTVDIVGFFAPGTFAGNAFDELLGVVDPEFSITVFHAQVRFCFGSIVRFAIANKSALALPYGLEQVLNFRFVGFGRGHW